MRHARPIIFGVATLAAFWTSCTDVTPVGSILHAPSGVPYREHDERFEDVLVALTGKESSDIWGIVTTRLMSQEAGERDTFASVDALFDMDGRGPLRSIECNGTPIDQNFEDLTGLQYARVGILHSGNFRYGDTAHWRFVLANGEDVHSVVAIPPALEPMLVAAQNDTISLGAPLRIGWSNPIAGGIVIVRLAWLRGDDAEPPAQRYVVSDSGGVSIPADSLRALAASPTGVLSVRLIRANYTDTLRYDSRARRLGNLAIVDAQNGYFVKP
jgi:hypothetical protein